MGPDQAQRGAAADLMPALPLDDAGPYVAAAYLVFLALILGFVLGLLAADRVLSSLSCRSRSLQRSRRP